MEKLPLQLSSTFLEDLEPGQDSTMETHSLPTIRNGHNRSMVINCVREDNCGISTILHQLLLLRFPDRGCIQPTRRHLNSSASRHLFPHDPVFVHGATVSLLSLFDWTSRSDIPTTPCDVAFTVVRRKAVTRGRLPRLPLTSISIYRSMIPSTKCWKSKFSYKRTSYGSWIDSLVYKQSTSRSACPTILSFPPARTPIY